MHVLGLFRQNCYAIGILFSFLHAPYYIQGLENELRPSRKSPI